MRGGRQRTEIVRSCCTHDVGGRLLESIWRASGQSLTSSVLLQLVAVVSTFLAY